MVNSTWVHAKLTSERQLKTQLCQTRLQNVNVRKWS